MAAAAARMASDRDPSDADEPARCPRAAAAAAAPSLLLLLLMDGAGLLSVIGGSGGSGTTSQAGGGGGGLPLWFAEAETATNGDGSVDGGSDGLCCRGSGGK